MGLARLETLNLSRSSFKPKRVSLNEESESPAPGQLEVAFAASSIKPGTGIGIDASDACPATSEIGPFRACRQRYIAGIYCPLRCAALEPRFFGVCL
jgi:hypothetical protein